MSSQGAITIQWKAGQKTKVPVHRDGAFILSILKGQCSLWRHCPYFLSIVLLIYPLNHVFGFYIPLNQSHHAHSVHLKCLTHYSACQVRLYELAKSYAETNT